MSKADERILRAIAGLPDDDWTPADWAVFDTAKAAAQRRLGVKGREVQRRREAEVLRTEGWWTLADARRAVRERSGGACELAGPECIAATDRLRQWKAEALIVLADWEKLHVVLGSPGRLAESKAAASLAEIERRSRAARQPAHRGPVVTAPALPDEGARPDLAQIRADASWLARLARGSSWPGEMAQRVDDAAARLTRWADGTGPAAPAPPTADLIESWLLEDGPSGMAHWVFAPDHYATDEFEDAGGERWTEEMVADYRRMSAGHLARMLHAKLADPAAAPLEGAS